MTSQTQRSAPVVVPVTRWSIRPAEHGRVRVRNNQRRHRERVKCRIKDLETKLAETQQELNKAFKIIEHLTARLEARRLHPANSSTAEFHTIDPESLMRLPALVDSYLLPLSLSESRVGPVTLDTIGVNEEIVGPDGSCNKMPLVGELVTMDPWDGILTGSELDQMAASGDGDGDHMQLPTRDESTTRCRDAFKIIVEQNYAAMDAVSLHSWLQPGFRRAHSKGDGCRVENTLLFSLLSYISS